MIVETIINLIKNLIFSVFSVINIPSFPDALTNSINSFITLIFDNAGLITLFVRWQTVLVGIPLVIIVVNFESFYKGIMWIIKKIPMLGMS